jgi:hypothetical protein
MSDLTPYSMPFPFSNSGTIEVISHEAASIQPIVLAIENAIRDSKPTSLRLNDGVLTYRAGVFRFVNNWNHLVSIGSGEIRFSQQGELVLIHYRISFVQMFIIVSVMVGLVFGFVAQAPLGSIVLGWLWLFGGNYLITLYRFPRFLRAAAEKARHTP